VSRPGGDVIFDWRLSRRDGELTSLLGEYRGVLQSDAYEAYAAFARDATVAERFGIDAIEASGSFAVARKSGEAVVS
jgi:hypothetical protein